MFSHAQTWSRTSVCPFLSRITSSLSRTTSSPHTSSARRHAVRIEQRAGCVGDRHPNGFGLPLGRGPRRAVARADTRLRSSRSHASGGTMHRLVRLGTAVAACVCMATSVGMAAGYPLTLTAHAKYTSGDTTITSIVTITVEKLMKPDDRTSVLDGLKYNGYPGFLNALRPLPVIGKVGYNKAQ